MNKKRTELELIRLKTNLAHLRSERNFSQIELSERTGIEIEDIRQLERGICPVHFSVPSLLRLADVLAISPDQLFI